MSFRNQQGSTITDRMWTNLLEYPRMLRRVLVGLTHAIPRKAISGQLGRVASQSDRPYEVTKLGELLPVTTIELKLRGWIDDNPSIEFPLAKHHRSTNTRVSRHDRFY